MDPLADPSLPFGHVATTTHVTVFGRTAVRIDCPLCDLEGTVSATPAETAHGVAAAIVAEHMRQTEEVTR